MNLFGPYTKQIPFQGGINAGIQPKKHGRGRALGLALADRCSTDDAPQRSAEAARPAAAAFGRCASKTEWVYCFKVALSVTPEGVIAAFGGPRQLRREACRRVLDSL